MTRPYPGVAGYGNPETFTSGSIKTLEMNQLLGLILVELRIANEMHREAYGLADTTDDLREAVFSALVNTAEIAPDTSISSPN